MKPRQLIFGISILIILLLTAFLINANPESSDPALKKAYSMTADDGVVYDLSMYDLGVRNPFSSFEKYNEMITKPAMLDNTYSLAVAKFIKDRCDGSNDCKDILILGDDFVVPSYRREIPTLEKKLFFFEDKDIKSIYTDIPYSDKETLQFANYYEMFRNQGKYEGKNVLIILPSASFSGRTQIDTQVTRLKNALKIQGYNPDFSEIDGKDVSCI